MALCVRLTNACSVRFSGGRKHEHIPTKNELEARRTRGSEVALQGGEGRALGDAENGMSQADVENLNSKWPSCFAQTLPPLLALSLPPSIAPLLAHFCQIRLLQ